MPELYLFKESASKDQKDPHGLTSWTSEPFKYLVES